MQKLMILSYEEVKDALEKLHQESSLYITDRVYKIVLDIIEMTRIEKNSAFALIFSVWKD